MKIKKINMSEYSDEVVRKAELFVSHILEGFAEEDKLFVRGGIAPTCKLFLAELKKSRINNIYETANFKFGPGYNIGLEKMVHGMRMILIDNFHEVWPNFIEVYKNKDSQGIFDNKTFYFNQNRTLGEINNMLAEFEQVADYLHTVI